MICSRSYTIEEVTAMYLADRARYYDDGSGPTREIENLRSGMKPLLAMMGRRNLVELDGPALAMLRDRWCKTDLSRTTINRRLQYAVRLLKWCVERGFARPEQLVSLQSVERVKRGRYGVRDRAPVRPADPSDVRAVLPELPPVIAELVELLQLTGMRPGEARTMRVSELERIECEGRPVYRYTPSRHKTAHLGKRRRIFIVGDGFELVTRRLSTCKGSSLFEPDAAGYLFSPDGSGRRPYAINSIHQAVRRACERVGVEPWRPNQLRHGFATHGRARGEQLELIADLLGHADPRTTLIYAEPDDDRALRAAIRLAT